MEKAVIIYASTHHGSTKKLAEAIANQYDVHLIDATKQHSADLSAYDLIGFASGIDFGKFYESVDQFLEKYGDIILGCPCEPNLSTKVLM